VPSLYDVLFEKVQEQIAGKVADQIMEELDLDGITDDVAEKVYDSDGMHTIMTQMHEDITTQLASEFENHLDEIVDIQSEDILEREYGRRF